MSGNGQKFKTTKTHNDIYNNNIGLLWQLFGMQTYQKKIHHQYSMRKKWSITCSKFQAAI